MGCASLMHGSKGAPDQRAWARRLISRPGAHFRNWSGWAPDFPFPQRAQNLQSQNSGQTDRQSRAFLLSCKSGHPLRCSFPESSELHLPSPWGMPGRLVTDSDLDAFSQYPSHGSFATPATRLIAETRGVARGFLSYYHVLPPSCPQADS